MDVKAPLDERYHQVAGVEVDLEAIRASIELIIRSGIEYEFRTTVCPPFHDKDVIEQIALAVRGAKKYVLQRFRPLNCLDPAFNDAPSYTEEQMRELADAARKYVTSCSVSGDADSVNH
jgi:pyruvate formate lyase activating enzyme